MFDIFLYNQTAETEADVIAWAGGQDGVAVYKDYVVLVPNGSPQQNMWLEIGRASCRERVFLSV